MTKPNFDQLRQFLNGLPTKEQERFAIKCGTTIKYLRKALSTTPQFDGALCRNIEVHSNSAVLKHFLRPDIWPELFDK